MVCSCSFDLCVVGVIPDANSRPRFVLSAMSVFEGFLVVEFAGLMLLSLLISSKRVCGLY